MKGVSLLVGVAVSLMACGSDHQDRPDPIVDPGGPFHTAVPGDRTISTLDPAEAQVLCADLVDAHRTFLDEAVVLEQICREEADAVGRQTVSQGGDYQTACQARYDGCKTNLATSSLWSCPLPASNCNATVLELSACLNEIAAATPLSLCVRVPLCDLAAPDPPPLPRTADLPPLPACVAFNGDCPVSGLTAGYLCSAP
jgi:hypothetical protein